MCLKEVNLHLSKSDKTFSVTEFFFTKNALRCWEGACDKETSETLKISWLLM